MAKFAINGQKSTSTLDVMFNTAKGFAESDNNFDGNLKFTDTCIFAKGIQLPGGKWIGVEALADVIKSGVEATLNGICFDELDDSEEKTDEERASDARKIGNSIHALYGAFLMFGSSAKEAEKFTIKYILELNLGFDAETIKEFLNSDLAAV